ncbi:uncharacterized protein LOC117590832 [Drosophila guanche]|uniref:uncharacterized protein LOC117590832 n=1 Tax=Drosophila guanche TaxID=7266 RepID=UPI0014710DE8|nr:uncharacterized protein LOC117590832 [Drosophila guanche]
MLSIPVLCIVCLIEMNHFVTLAARPIPRATEASYTAREPLQLPIDEETNPAWEYTMGAGEGGILYEDGIGEPRPRDEELSAPNQIDCESPNRKRLRLIEELYCEALLAAESKENGVHYRIHRMPI